MGETSTQVGNGSISPFSQVVAAQDKVKGLENKLQGLETHKKEEKENLASLEQKLETIRDNYTPVLENEAMINADWATKIGGALMIAGIFTSIAGAATFNPIVGGIGGGLAILGLALLAYGKIKLAVEIDRTFNPEIPISNPQVTKNKKDVIETPLSGFVYLKPLINTKKDEIEGIATQIEKESAELRSAKIDLQIVEFQAAASDFFSTIVTSIANASGLFSK